MVTAAAIVWVYAAIIFAGGLQGYISKGSIPSIAASGVSALLLVAAGMGVKNGKSWGVTLAAVVMVALMLFFGRQFLKSQAVMPHGFNALISVVSLLALAGLVLNTTRRVG